MELEARRRHTEQMYLEFETACFTYSVKLRRPLILITQVAAWGSWDAGTRTLRLSERLFSGELPWVATVEVLKHEIAHMIVSEIDGCPDDAHGPYFRRACRRLGISARASYGRCDFLGMGATATDAPSDNARALLRRVERLLALSRSDNEHEAVLAVQRAREIYETFENDVPLTEDSNLAFEVISVGKKRFAAHELQLASILTEGFRVYAIETHLYDPVAQCTFRAFEFGGATGRVQLATYVWHFMMRVLTQLYASRPTKERGDRQSFYRGVLEGLEIKLRALLPATRTTPPLHEENRDTPATTPPPPRAGTAACRGSNPPEAAIVPLSSLDASYSRRDDMHVARVADAFSAENVLLRQRHPRLRTVYHSRSGVRDGSAYADGQRAGRGLQLSKPISGAGGGQITLIARRD